MLHIMADEALIVGLEKLQVEGTQHSEKLKAMKEKIILPEKLKCDSFESSDDSGSDSKSDSKSESGSANEKEVKSVSRGERKKKKKALNKKIKKNETKKNEGDASKDDKLQCDNSDSKSGSVDDSSDSGDESKSQSGSEKVRLEEVKQMEKKKGLIEKIREKLSRKPKEETAEVANTDISDMKEENMKNIDKLLCDSSDSKSGSGSDSGSESSSATKKDTHVVKGGSKTEKKNKVLKKKMKKKATKKNEREANMADKLQCDNSDSKSGSGDNSGSDSKSDSKSESGSSSEKENSKEKRANKENKKGLAMGMKEQSIKKRGEEANRTPGTNHEVVVDAKVDMGIAMVNAEIIKAMEEDQDVGKKVTKNEVDEQGAAEKKGIFGKIMERLPSYYKKGGK